jgi:hypothetical protein
MTDIVERLNNPPFGTETSERKLMAAARDEIVRLRAERDRLRDALKRARGELWHMPHIVAEDLRYIDDLLTPQHASDCALHHGPAYKPEPCNCGAEPGRAPEDYGSEFPADPGAPTLAEATAALKGDTPS